MINYYRTLGIPETASGAEIKAAFKKMAVKYHPDKHAGNSGMEEKFKEINEAYQVLSDPHAKARHDLKLKYRQFSDTPSAAPYSYQRKYYRRPTYTPPRVDYRQNTIATLYAFAITLGIAIIVMIGVWVKEGYDERQLEQLLAERRATFKQARASFDNEDYEQAFKLMSGFQFFRLEERDMKLFKDNMVNEIINKGNQYYRLEDYDHAIHLYELVQQFESKKPLFTLKTQLAEAYKKVDQPVKSIEIYEDLLVKEYRRIAALVEIAEIHRDMLEDYEAAWDYYLRAQKISIKQYKNFYGEAYSLVIDERYVPAEHYDLYVGLADIYLRLDNPEMAIKAAKWNKYVWPDSVDAYLTSADAYIAQNNPAQACEEYEDAQVRGWKGERAISCEP